MAIRKAFTVASGRNRLLPASDRLTNVGSSYFGVTKRDNSEYDSYYSSGVTNASGRITFNLTTDGTTSGPAIFSAVHGIDAICQTSSTNVALIGMFYVETISANLKQITIRGVGGSGASNKIDFVGAGITGRITVRGLP